MRIQPSSPPPIKSAQSSLASNPFLRSITNKLEGNNEPNDDKQHRSVGVDPDFYDMVDDNILSILLNACKPLFDLVSSSSPDSKGSTMKPADLLMSTAKLIIAAGFKMKEKARQDMAEEDLGGGMFDKDVKGMREFAAKVPLPQVYDPGEQQMLDTQHALHDAPGKVLRRYKTGTKLFTCQLADTGRGVDVRAEMEIRAPVEQVLGYFMGHLPLYDKHITSENDAKIVLGERSSDHSLFAMAEIPMPAPFHDREVVTRSLWKKLDESAFLYVQASCEHDEFPRRAGVVRMDLRRSFKLTRIRPKLTKLVVSGSMGMGGVIPRRINDSVTIPVAFTTLTNVTRYFVCVRPADSFDEGDGTVLGRLLFLEMHPHRQNRDLLNEKIVDMIRMTNVLRSAQAKYRFFDELLYHVIRNQMRKGAVQTSFAVETPLVALTAKEAGRISRSFIVVMMSNATPQSAVDEHIGKFLALRELDREYAWFRPMMEAIAIELMRDVAMGVKLRAGLGAGLSLMDMVSDTIIIRDLFKTPGKGPFAKALLACLAFNLTWQVVLVLMQSAGLQRNRLRTMLLESLAVVSFIKP
ncbi:hypothetical protein TeGR_g8236, partial [Tetraparma gracilis]